MASWLIVNSTAFLVSQRLFDTVPLFLSPLEDLHTASIAKSMTRDIPEEKTRYVSGKLFPYVINFMHVLF